MKNLFVIIPDLMPYLTIAIWIIAYPYKLIKSIFSEHLLINFLHNTLKHTGALLVVLIAALSLKGGVISIDFYETHGAIALSLSLIFLTLLPIGFGFFLLNTIKRYSKIPINYSKSTGLTIVNYSKNEETDICLPQINNKIKLFDIKELLLKFSLTVFGITIFIFFLHNPEINQGVNTLISHVINLMEAFKPILVNKTLGYIISCTGVLLLIILTFSNINHLHIKPLLFYVLYLAVFLMSSLLIIMTDNHKLAAAVMLYLLLLVLNRIIIEIKLIKSRKNKISTQLDQEFNILAESFSKDLKYLLRSGDLYYHKIDKDSIRKQTKACVDSLKDTDFLTPMYLGKSMRKTEIIWNRSVLVEARFLTVDRFIQEISLGGTSKPRGGPTVPIWDEKNFPLLNIPFSYTEQNDALDLGPKWNVVESCGSCGGEGKLSCPKCKGSGEVDVDHGGHTTQERCPECYGKGEVTCYSCSGLGKVEYRRKLITKWMPKIISCLYPSMKIYEFSNTISEFDFANLKIVENRKNTIECSYLTSLDILPSGLKERMEYTRPYLADWMEKHRKHTAGITYRTELAISGFTFFNAIFNDKSKAKACFFGNSNNVYFSHLPIDWKKILLILIMPFFCVDHFLFYNKYLLFLLRSYERPDQIYF